MGERISFARARELGDELRRYREEQEIPANELAERLGWSPTKISRIEAGTRNITEIDVVRYGAHCGLTRESIDAMLSLYRESGLPGYWLSKRLDDLIFHESRAAASSSYDPLVVPGLLQTEDYAAELIGRHRPTCEYLVEARMERQRLVGGRPFEFFIHEQALRLPVGGGRVMNEQLLKLALLTDQPHITIRVVPTALGAAAAFGGSFVLFRYAGHPPLVYLEHGPIGLFLEDQQYSSRYSEKLASLSESALSREESRELLATLASEFDLPEVSPDASDHLAEEHF